jgi:hypothetical protein
VELQTSSIKQVRGSMFNYWVVLYWRALLPHDSAITFATALCWKSLAGRETPRRDDKQASDHQLSVDWLVWIDHTHVLCVRMDVHAYEREREYAVDRWLMETSVDRLDRCNQLTLVPCTPRWLPPSNQGGTF